MTAENYRIEAYHVGTLPIPGWEAFFGVNDQTFHDLAFYVWVVRSESIVCLVDLGLPPGADDLAELIRACQAVDPRCEFRDVRSLADVLSEAGLAPEDVDVAVLTQPITYHSGGLEAELLPRAHVYVPQAGLIEMLVDPPGHPSVEMYFTSTSWAYLRDLAVEGRLHVTDGPAEVAPGIVLETTGGHHPGSAAVRIETTEGLVTLLETAFFDRNIAEGTPIGIAENAALTRSVILRERTRGQVVALHDPRNAARFSGTR